MPRAREATLAARPDQNQGGLRSGPSFTHVVTRVDIWIEGPARLQSTTNGLSLPGAVRVSVQRPTGIP